MPLSWLRSLRRKGIFEIIPDIFQITVRGANIIVIVEAEITLIDTEKAIDSVKKIAALDFDILCFGHGRPFKEGVHDKMQKLVTRLK